MQYSARFRALTVNQKTTTRTQYNNNYIILYYVCTMYIVQRDRIIYRVCPRERGERKK